MSWRQGQTATLTQVLLMTIAALLSHLGWGCSTVGHWGPKALCLPLALTSASCLQLTRAVWAPGYIIVSHPPASAVLPLIYTGASLDWRLGRGSIYNRSSKLYPVSAQNCCWSVYAGRPTLVQPYEWVHRKMLLKSSSMHLQLCLAWFPVGQTRLWRECLAQLF